MSGAATLRRGACPGLTTPMPAGDGLLARLMPVGTISLDAMAGLGAAARQHGNAIVEITSRGSIQIRGLSEASAPLFAEAVARLGIAAQDGVPVIANPLTGLEARELIDAGALAAKLRHELIMRGLALSPKVSVAIDGGGTLHLDGLSADIRLRAIDSSDGALVHFGVGGDAANAMPLRTAPISEAIDTVVALLEKIAAHGPAARGRDLVRHIGTPSPPPRVAAEPIGTHSLRDGTRAVGLSFAFGHTDAATLDKLLHAARTARARGLRIAPGRALLIVGIAENDVARLSDAAAMLGFIVARDDPRRRVVACAGAPVCAAAHIPTRPLAPEIANHAAPLLGADEVIHVSGCRKGCAHHGPAALTAIGRDGACDLLVGDAPAGSCAVAALPHRLAALAAQRSARHG